MKLITLNIWGGRLLDPLLTFIKDMAKTDVFCFQEVYSSPIEKKISHEMQANIYEQIASLLKNHQVFFAPHLKNIDLQGKVDFDLSTGLAMFIKKPLQVKEQGDLFIHRSGFELIDNNYETIPRNLQYVVIIDNNVDYLISHFHGIWFPKTKRDTPDRINQAKRINQFLSSRKEKIVLCGDFNLLPDTQSMSILEAGMKNLIKDFNITTTRNHFYQRGEKYADYILVSSDILVSNFEVLNTTVSDHLPLYLDFE